MSVAKLSPRIHTGPLAIDGRSMLTTIMTWYAVATIAERADTVVLIVPRPDSNWPSTAHCSTLSFFRVLPACFSAVCHRISTLLLITPPPHPSTHRNSIVPHLNWVCTGFPTLLVVIYSRIMTCVPPTVYRAPTVPRIPFPNSLPSAVRSLFSNPRIPVFYLTIVAKHTKNTKIGELKYRLETIENKTTKNKCPKTKVHHGSPRRSVCVRAHACCHPLNSGCASLLRVFWAFVGHTSRGHARQRPTHILYFPPSFCGSSFLVNCREKGVRRSQYEVRDSEKSELDKRTENK